MKMQLIIKRFVLVNVLMSLVGFAGRSGLDEHVFQAFVSDSKHDGTHDCKRLLQVHTMVEVLSVVLIWFLYFFLSLKWDDDNRAIFLVITVVHALFWTLTYAVCHFAGGAGLLS